MTEQRTNDLAQAAIYAEVRSIVRETETIESEVRAALCPLPPALVSYLEWLDEVDRGEA